MTTYALAGTVTTGSTAAGLIDVSDHGYNQPPASTGKVVSYADPSVSTVGTVTAGTADGLPNNVSVPLTPFLRTTFASARFATDVSSGVTLKVPKGRGILKDDLMVAAMVTTSDTTVPTWLSSGWTLQSSVVDLSVPVTMSIWTRVATSTEDGRAWSRIGGDSFEFVQVRVYGNAVFDKAVIAENPLGSAGESTTPALSDADVYGSVVYFWTGQFGSTPSLVANIPSPLGNVVLNLNASNVGAVSADLAVVSPIRPGRTALLTPKPSFPAFGKMFQTVVSLKPYPSYRYADVSLEEATGAAEDIVEIESYVHIVGADKHSPQTAYGFTQDGMNGDGPGTVYSYERWVRVRFGPNFNTVRAFRFWAPNLTSIPTGWTVKYGTTSSYATPVGTASSIATHAVPTSDPGQASPNAGGGTRLAGTGTQYSDWIVLQASANTAVVAPGPVLGFSLEGVLIPIEFAFSWTET